MVWIVPLGHQPSTMRYVRYQSGNEFIPAGTAEASVFWRGVYQSQFSDRISRTTVEVQLLLSTMCDKIDNTHSSRRVSALGRCVFAFQVGTIGTGAKYLEASCILTR